MVGEGGTASELVAQPWQVVVDEVWVQPPLPGRPDDTERAVQHDMFETHPGALGEEVHLADGFCLVSVSGELTREGNGKGPGNVIVVADAAVGRRALAGEQGRACGNASRARRVCAVEPGPAPSESIQERRPHHRVVRAAQAVPAPLVGHDQDDVGPVSLLGRARLILLAGLVGHVASLQSAGSRWTDGAAGHDRAGKDTSVRVGAVGGGHQLVQQTYGFGTHVLAGDIECRDSVRNLHVIHRVS